jgi:hypothetical protein
MRKHENVWRQVCGGSGTVWRAQTSISSENVGGSVQITQELECVCVEQGREISENGSVGGMLKRTCPAAGTIPLLLKPNLQS